MLYEFFASLFVLLCFLMILIILFQKSKGSLGVIGSAGSGAQMLFGGTGGQDLFQKITWGFVAFFLGGSLMLAVLKNRQVNQSSYLTKSPATSATAPSLPLQKESLEQKQGVSESSEAKPQ